MTHLRDLAAALVVACAMALTAAVATAGWWDDAGAARRTTLDEIRKDPDRWRDVTVVIDVRFARVVEPGNPFFTRFTSREWRAVGAFAPDATPDTMSSSQPFERIFVRRGSECERRLADVTAGRRLQLRAAVRDSAKGDPWIEAIEVVVDGDPLTPEEATAAARADDFLAHGNAAGAEPVFRGLLAKRALPKATQAAFWRKIGAACWAQRHIAEAADAYSAALAVEPNDAATADRLVAAMAALATPRTVASISPSSAAPELPASLTAPLDLPTAPARRLLPPAGMSDDPSAAASAPAPRPAAVESNPEPVPPPRPVAPAAEPAQSTPPQPPESASPPPAAPRRELAGPK